MEGLKSTCALPRPFAPKRKKNKVWMFCYLLHFNGSNFFWKETHWVKLTKVRNFYIFYKMIFTKCDDNTMIRLDDSKDLYWSSFGRLKFEKRWYNNLPKSLHFQQKTFSAINSFPWWWDKCYHGDLLYHQYSLLTPWRRSAYLDQTNVPSQWCWSYWPEVYNSKKKSDHEIITYRYLHRIVLRCLVLRTILDISSCI